MRGSRGLTRAAACAAAALLAGAAAGGTCPGDADDSGVVDVQDLVTVITNWNCVDPPGPCPGDVNGSGVTDVQDLVAVIVGWGPCPGPACQSPQGAPANDCCADATVISGIAGIGDSVTLSFDTTSAGTDGPDDPSNPCNSGSDDSQIWKDVWYRFTAPEKGQLVVSNCLQGEFDSKIAAYLGSDCGDLPGNLVDCNEDCFEDAVNFTSTLVIDVAAGQTYTVRLGGFSDDNTEGSAGNGPGQVTFTLAGAVLPPINDACQNAIAITSTSTPFDTTAATTDGVENTTCAFPFGDDQVYHDIWFTYTTPQGGVLQLSTCNQAAFDTRLVVYDNSPAAPCPPTNAQVLACNDDGAACAGFSSFLSMGVSGGQDLLIRVGGFAEGDAGAGTLTLGVSGVPNDICEFAQLIAPGESDTVDLCLAQAESAPDCGNGVAVNESVWYVTEGDGSTYTASLCGNPGFVFTRLTVYCTTSGTSDCDDLFCDLENGLFEPIDKCGVNEEISFCTVDGRRYLMLVHHDFKCGEVTINVSSDASPCGVSTCDPPIGACCVSGSCLDSISDADCAEVSGFWVEAGVCGQSVNCPPNDECDDALPVGEGCWPVNNTLSTTTLPNVLPATCEEGFGLGIKKDLWYRYTPSTSGTATISTCNSMLIGECNDSNWDSRLAAYQNDCGTLVLIGCNDDGDGCANFSSYLQIPVTAGVPVIVRLGSYDDLDADPDDGVNGGSGTGVLEITVEP
jgi:hypothetical protein